MTATQLMAPHQFQPLTRTLSFTSGKGGVGKSSVAANVGLQLAREGSKVLLLDGDISMANLDLMFGVRPTHTLEHVVNGEATLESAIIEVDRNLCLLPGGSGVRALQNMSEIQRRDIFDQVSMLPQCFDYMVIDTAPGIDDNVLSLNASAHDINVIVTPDPSSLTDAYALIKVLNRDYRIERFTIVANQVRDEDEGLAIYKRISDVAHKFLFVSLDYAGAIPMDPYLRQATRSQKMVIKAFDQAPSSLAVKNLVRRFKSTKGTQYLHGGLSAFWTQLVGLAC